MSYPGPFARFRKDAAFYPTCTSTPSKKPDSIINRNNTGPFARFRKDAAFSPTCTSTPSKTPDSIINPNNTGPFARFRKDAAFSIFNPNNTDYSQVIASRRKYDGTFVVTCDNIHVSPLLSNEYPEPIDYLPMGPEPTAIKANVSETNMFKLSLSSNPADSSVECGIVYESLSVNEPPEVAFSAPTSPNPDDSLLSNFEKPSSPEITSPPLSEYLKYYAELQLIWSQPLPSPNVD